MAVETRGPVSEALARPLARAGGGFLVAPVPRGGTFAREKLSEEQRQFGDAARDFWQKEVLPRVEEIERKAHVVVDGKELPLGVALLRKAGEIGILAIDVPEAYGGLGQSKTTSMYVAELLAGCASQGATIGAHAGIGTMPIVLFGNEDQKSRYLPRIASGELVSCYMLTEPGNGSDALSGKTAARLSEDGKSYLVRGEKIYITNGSWADVGIVFANIDGKYSALIVDMRQEGVSRGAEEKKMGIRGSSTTSVIFQDAVVPVENLLGKVGDGPSIALNILYLGRAKLGFGDLGTSKYAIDKTIAFGKERRQFGQPVITFDLQRAKLADMCAQVFALDSLSYRGIGEIDQALAALPEGPGFEERQIEVLRSFAVEFSIMKVFGSETLMRVANHAVRMHGGYGFIEEYQVERVARDNVVDTIFEGTNDINRLVAFGALVQNAYTGAIPFREFMEEVWKDLRSGVGLCVPQEAGPVAEELGRVYGIKRALAYATERALIGVGKDVRVEQQVGAAVVDGLIALYGAECAVARVHDLLTAGAGERTASLRALARLLVHEAGKQVRQIGRDLLPHVCLARDFEARSAEFERLCDCFDAPADPIALRRTIADRAIEAGRYDW